MGGMADPEEGPASASAVTPPGGAEAAASLAALMAFESLFVVLLETTGV
jgi:hypothetical protein